MIVVDYTCAVSGERLTEVILCPVSVRSHLDSIASKNPAIPE